MKKMALLVALALGWSGAALAQNHGEVGAFGEYFRINLGNTPRSLLGVGARASFNVHSNIQLEAELAYDFERAFTENFNNGVPNSSSFARSNVRVLHGLFGPKIQTGGGAVRLFATVKGGFLNLGFNNQSPGAGFSSAINNLRAEKSNAVLYPGGGVEAYLGPIGLRLDAGDEIYFNNGAVNNFRLTFGPHIRF